MAFSKVSNNYILFLGRFFKFYAMNNNIISQLVGDGDGNHENESLLLQVDPYVSISGIYGSTRQSYVTISLFCKYLNVSTYVGSDAYLGELRLE